MRVSPGDTRRTKATQLAFRSVQTIGPFYARAGLVLDARLNPSTDGPNYVYDQASTRALPRADVQRSRLTFINIPPAGARGSTFPSLNATHTW